MKIKIFKYTLAIIFAYVAFFALVVYPNDYRIGFPSSVGSLNTKSRQAEHKALQGSWPEFTLNISEQAYADALALARRQTNHYLGENFGLASPYLVNHSIGSYPDRIEGSQGINLPVGAALELRPGVSGSLDLQLKVTAIGGSPTLETYKNQIKLDAINIKEPPPPTDLSTKYYKILQKYLFVDRPELAEPWTSYHLPLDLAQTDKIRFECTGTSGSCFISRPEFMISTDKQKSNYLIILVDTLKQNAVTQDSAAYIDSLRSQAREYTRTYAAGNLSSQSTNAFLTCQKPSNIGSLAFSYNMPALAKTQFYARAQPSFAHFFKRAGWKTGMIGNISIISEVMGAGIDHGYEDQIAIEREAYDTAKISAEAINWLQTNRHRPFLLYLHYHATHAPYRPPLRDIADSYLGIEDLSSMPNILHWLYRGEVQYTDRYVKKVIEALKPLGLAENTKIVFTADHGDQQKIHTFSDNKASYAETGAFFDHGATLLNDEIHIPLMFLGFNQLPKGSSDDNITSNLDIAPTLLDDAGIDIPTWCDGISLISAERNADKQKQFNRVVGSEGIRQRAIYFDNRYKYTVSYSTTEKNLFRSGSYNREMFELFDRELLIDLTSDPNEDENLYSRNPELLAVAKKHFDDYFRTKYLWELVFESPDLGEMATDIDARYLPIKYQGLDVAENNGTVTISMQGNQRGTATFDRPLRELPTVMADSNPVPVLNTYAKLNLNTTDLGLPVETIGEDSLLPVGSKKLAFIRKVAKTDFQERKIVAGNPQFEAILREWGYLNDN